MVSWDLPVDLGWETGKADFRMGEVSRTGRDLTRCFGRYRAQTPQYALDFCVSCPALKSCVRAAWGVDDPRRTVRRAVWWESTRRAAPLVPAPTWSTGHFLAT